MTIEFVNLPPERAVRFFKAKGRHFGFDWRDTAANAHQVSFTAAKVMEQDVLIALQSSVARAQKEGIPYEAWLADLKPELQRLGWWGKLREKDPATGKIVEFAVGPRRLKLIYDTNLRAAAAAGRWAKIEDAAAERPFLQYVAVEDARVRPDHLAWNDTILPWDHPWWKTHYPPNGWKCRCTVLQWSADDLADRGLKVSDDPEVQRREWLNKRTGEIQRIPVGIDPGWDHNVGRLDRPAALRNLLAERAVQVDAPVLGRALKPRTSDFKNRQFHSFLAHGQEGWMSRWPMAWMSADRATALGLPDKPAMVTLSGASAAGHRARYTSEPFQRAATWGQVQELVDKGEWVMDAAQPNHRVIWYEFDGKPWVAVVKRVEETGEWFLVSYRRGKAAETDRLREQIRGVQSEGLVGSPLPSLLKAGSALT